MRANQFIDDGARGFPPVWVFDGGARTFCPTLDEHSLTISCFGKGHIRYNREKKKKIGLHDDLFQPCCPLTGLG